MEVEVKFPVNFGDDLLSFCAMCLLVWLGLLQAEVRAKGQNQEMILIMTSLGANLNLQTSYANGGDKLNLGCSIKYS